MKKRIEDATWAVLFCMEGAGDKERRWRMQDHRGNWMTVIPLWHEGNTIEFAIENDRGKRDAYVVTVTEASDSRDTGDASREEDPASYRDVRTTRDAYDA